MQNSFIENEIKIIDADTAEVANKLLKLGFEQQTVTEFKRYIFDLPSGEKNAWIRLRSDGKHATVTYKRVLKDSIDGVEEIEVTVDNFDRAKELLSAAGLKQVSYQENTRKSFLQSGIEVSIDSWPLIPPYIEIEAPTKAEVEDTLHRLGLSKHKLSSLPTKDIYEMYGLHLDDYKVLKFED